MKLTLCVDDDRKVIIPAEAIESLHLEPGASVQVEVASEAAKPYVFNQAKFDAAMEYVDKIRPAFRARMIADGFNSVDEYMDWVRPQW